HVVDEHVDPPVALESSADRERPDARVADVGHQARTAGEVGHGGVGALPVDVDDEHGGTLLGEGFADAAADPAGPARDDGDLPGEQGLGHAYSGATDM